MMKAVITGAGQDSSYLAELLLSKDYEVVCFTKRNSSNNKNKNIEHLLNNPRFHFMNGDITDATFVSRILHEWKPHSYYNLAAQSHVGYSFKDPLTTFKIDAEAVIMQLELIRQISPYTRFYQASTSELFGGIGCPEQGFDESSPFHPRSPYAVAKAAAFHAVVNYREAYGLYACNGILFNHSSPRRGHDFATRKITRGVAAIKLGMSETIKMGNLSAFRDEGHASDYVLAQYLMLDQEKAKDYVISTKDGATIEDMLRYVCSLANLNFDDVYEMDERFMRPSDVQYLLGNSTLAQKELGWTPKYNWKSLLREMYENDLQELQGNLKG